MLSRRSTFLSKTELRDIFKLRAKTVLGRVLTDVEEGIFLDEIFSTSVYNDKIVLGALYTVANQSFVEARQVFRGCYANTDDFEETIGDLLREGFVLDVDFEIGAVFSELRPFVVAWRVTSNNIERIRKFDPSFKATLAGTLKPLISCLNCFSREELYDVLRYSVVGTVPLATGLNILRRAKEQGRKGLIRYIVNLHLTGSDLGLQPKRPKRGWGSELSLRRKDINLAPSDYVSYDLQYFFPTSDAEQPSDNMRMQEEYLDQVDNGRRLNVKKVKKTWPPDPTKKEKENAL